MVILLLNITRLRFSSSALLSKSYSVHDHGKVGQDTNFRAGKWKMAAGVIFWQIRGREFHRLWSWSSKGKLLRLLHSFSYKLGYDDFARQQTVCLNIYKLPLQWVCEDGSMALLSKLFIQPPLHQTLSWKLCVRSRALMGPSWLYLVRFA